MFVPLSITSIVYQNVCPSCPNLKDLKASDVEDSQEGGSLAFGFVQGLVDSAQDPAEESLKHSFSQGLSSKVSLANIRVSSKCSLNEASLVFVFHTVCSLWYLLFGLCLLHHLPAHFDPRGEDGPSEVRHIDALQVTHLLGR